MLSRRLGHDEWFLNVVLQTFLILSRRAGHDVPSLLNLSRSTGHDGFSLNRLSRVLGQDGFSRFFLSRSTAQHRFRIFVHAAELPVALERLMTPLFWYVVGVSALGVRICLMSDAARTMMGLEFPMRLVPKGKDQRINFFASRVAKWLENADQLRMPPERVEEFAAKVAETREAYRAAHAARNAAQAATMRLNALIQEMSQDGAKLIQVARSNEEPGDAKVSVLALIPPKAKRSPLGPPGTPFGFQQQLGDDGAITLTWKCRNPRGSQGTAYNVYRRNGHSGPFEHLAAVGEKKFTDITVPIGTGSVTYKVRAFRSTGAGQAATHTVTFGGGLPVFVSRRDKLRATGPDRAAA
jgi:hypothetical protein